MIDALRVRGAAYLLFTAAVGRLPSAMSALAIVRLVRSEGGDFGAASVLTAAYVIASTVGQPALGRVIDRTGHRRTVLMCSGVVATLALVGLAFVAADAVLLGLVLALIAGFATPPVESCLRALWPRMMTPGAQLRSAFSIDAAASELVFVAGPLLTTLGILLFGANGNILFMAALGLLGTAAFAIHPLIARAAAEPLAPHHEHGADGRLHGPLASAPFRILLVLQVAVGVPIGVVTITATGFGELHGIAAAGGWGLSANAVGAFTGAVLIGRRPFRTEPARVTRWVAVALGVLYLPTAAVGAPVPVWIVLAYIAGLSLPPFATQIFSQTQAIIPMAQLTEANAWVISAFTVGVAAGTVAAGFIAEALPGGAGLSVAVLVGSGVALLGAVVGHPSLLRAPVRPAVETSAG